MIFFSRLEFVPAQINGQKNTIAARDLGLWVGCTAVLLLYCLLYRDPRSMPPNTVRTSSQHSTPAHLVWLFFSLCPWRLKSSLTEDGRGPEAPARPEPLFNTTFTLYTRKTPQDYFSAITRKASLKTVFTLSREKYRTSKAPTAAAP